MTETNTTFETTTESVRSTPLGNKQPEHAPDRGGFNAGSFVVGLIFMVLGVAFALEANGQWTFRLDHFRYVGPLVLIVIGLSILAGAGLGRLQDPTTPTN